MAEYVIGALVPLLPTSPGLHMTLAYLGRREPAEVADIITAIETRLSARPVKPFALVFDDYSMLGPNNDIRVRNCHFVDDESVQFAQWLYDSWGVKQPFHTVKEPKHHYHVTLKPEQEAALAHVTGFTASVFFVKQIGKAFMPLRDFDLSPA